MGMTNEEIKQEIYFAEMVIGAINHVKVPMLIYDEEKVVVQKALYKYKQELENELRGR